MDLTLPEEQHNIEIHQNLTYWKKKPLLQKVYYQFYDLIKQQINQKIPGKIVELGSGVGNIKSVINDAICTDLFANPWIDQVENAYQLSFTDEEVSHIILFDVFHHLEFYGNALEEFYRVLKKDGRIIIFEPDISLLGLFVYGLMHHEPVNVFKKIKWKAPEGVDLLKLGYYAAQGNANRIFNKRKYKNQLQDWQVIKIKRIAAISYILTGGYSKPQLLPAFLLNLFFHVDKFLSHIPFLFSTRIMIVLEKK